MSPTETIRLIDKRIDGVVLETFRRVGRFNTLSVDSWQLAWDPACGPAATRSTACAASPSSTATPRSIAVTAPNNARRRVAA